LDAHDRVVFEGDIVEIELRPAGTRVRGVVTFQKETASFCVKLRSGDEPIRFFGREILPGSLVVLGNIHENAELLRTSGI
jgi:hypothetical protein